MIKIKKATKKKVKASRIKASKRKAKKSENLPVHASGPPSEKVGRGKPPKHTQFKKGESGNIKGRPKGSKNLATLIADAAYDQITVTTKSGEKRKLSRIQATTLQLANKAAQGDVRSILKFMEWVDAVEERAAAARPPEMPIGDADLKVLHEIYTRMKLCEPSETN